MAFGIFIHRPDTHYDDAPDRQYQFPRQYLARAQALIGDWIVYYEPAKVPNSRGYFAVAKLDTVVPDPTREGHYLALMAAGSYLDFPFPVPRFVAGSRVERSSPNDQWAVRPLSAADFGRIVELGLDGATIDDLETRLTPAGFAEPQAAFDYGPTERLRALSSRTVRDPAFRALILKNYDSRCAFTGLRLINGGGATEVEAAHIWPVESNGPDHAANGLALSRTVHWMFDRGLLSLADSGEIMVSRHINDVDSMRAMLNRDGRALLPAAPWARPAARFLAWHRDNRFKH